jgi:alpha-1,2-mannosyltransferase
MGIGRNGGNIPPRGLSRIIRAASLLLAGGLIVFLILQALSATCEGDGNDLASYCRSSLALMEGGNPYATGSPFPYIYPLFLALIITPLAVLPCPAAALIWALTGLGSLAGALVIIRRHVPAPLPVALLVGLCLVIFDVIQNNIVNGQVNFLVLFLCTVGFHFSSRDRYLPAALTIGAAAAIKLTPLIMLCYLAARRQWFAAGGTVLVFLLFCLLPGLIPGVDLEINYGQYVQEFLVAQLTDGTVPQGHVDFSLAGFLSRAELPLKSVATAALILLIPGAIMWWDVRALGPQNSSVEALHDLRAFSLYMMVPLFAVPMSEVHHLIQALPAFFCLVVLTKLSGRRRNWILPAMSLTVYLIGSLTWREGPLYFVSLVILFFGVLLANRRDGIFRFSGQ